MEARHWQLLVTECAPPSRHGWHLPRPDGRYGRFRRRVAAGPIPAPGLRSSLNEERSAPRCRCLLQRHRRLREEPGVCLGSWMGTQDTYDGFSPTPDTHLRVALVPPSLDTPVVAVQTPCGLVSALGPAPESPLVAFSKGRNRGSAPSSSLRRPVLLRTLANWHRAGPRCSAGPTDAATACGARGAQSS